MCWRCDHPGATYDEYLTYMHGLITRWGWAVQGVQRDGPHPPWAYTAGLTEAGLAERRRPGSLAMGERIPRTPAGSGSARLPDYRSLSSRVGAECISGPLMVTPSRGACPARPQ
jgi:hypothetical protein